MPPASNQTLLLVDEKGQTHLVDLSKPRQELPGVGRFASSMLAEAAKNGPGAMATLGGKQFRLIEPSLADTLEGLKRGPQWVSLKDGSWLVAACGLRAGDFVAEAGAGSGALTVQLAWAVAPGGRVVSLDNRPDHLKVAKANVEKASLSHLVHFLEADASSGIPALAEVLTEHQKTKDMTDKEKQEEARLNGGRKEEKKKEETDLVGGDTMLGKFPGFKAVILDLPQPWEVLEAAAGALRPGGFLACYLPTVNQVDRLVEALKAANAENQSWTPPNIVENLQREWQARTRALRPHTRMLGHTGFIVTSRWLGL